MNRRVLLKALWALPWTVPLSRIRAETPTARAMLRRAIPRSGESLPVVGLGTYQTFDVGDDRAAREPLREVLRALVEHGGSVIDSSPMYGSSEAVVGELCAELELRPRLFLATKVWTSGRDAGVRQMEQSLRRMRAESLDLMQIHNLVDWRTHARTLREWKQAGRIRYAGVTHYHSGAYDELERVMKTRQFDFVQLNYSIAEREAEETLLPLAQELGMAVIANRPFAQASLFSRVQGRPLPSWAAEFDCGSWAQFFLKYILAHPAVTCVIPATSKPKHMLDNLMAGYGKLPDEKARRRMTQFLSGL
jgi:diketogulonate reductase-like aldo/keto reductase